ncbi:hypothetical protein Prudu_017334 [Prunus dulcis]|uniref:Uncharacterized protein n=1 Tax=Prunus dulcis TaxID=3755 RepID=A0A4Y1RN78_PRUDU|nr:hypothetical protein Prudu_017334 [Prunus dulcis]
MKEKMVKSQEHEHPKKAFGWAARDSSGVLSLFSQEGEKDVAFKVLYCGICHTDLHMVKNDWGFSTYPLVPGEILLVRHRPPTQPSEAHGHSRVGQGMFGCDRMTYWQMPGLR